MDIDVLDILGGLDTLRADGHLMLDIGDDESEESGTPNDEVERRWVCGRRRLKGVARVRIVRLVVI